MTPILRHAPAIGLIPPKQRPVAVALCDESIDPRLNLWKGIDFQGMDRIRYIEHVKLYRCRMVQHVNITSTVAWHELLFIDFYAI